MLPSRSKQAAATTAIKVVRRVLPRVRHSTLLKFSGGQACRGSKFACGGLSETPERSHSSRGGSLRFRTLLAIWEGDGGGRREAIFCVERRSERKVGLIGAGAATKVASMNIVAVPCVWREDAPLYDAYCLACSSAVRVRVRFRFLSRGHAVKMAPELSCLVQKSLQPTGSCFSRSFVQLFFLVCVESSRM